MFRSCRLQVIGHRLNILIGKMIRIWIGFCLIFTSYPLTLTTHAGQLNFPAPGLMVHLSPESNPPVLKGVTVHPENPFRFDFILDKGDSYPDDSKAEATKLIKYFLASITTPEKDLWVNLSPYEKNRIVPESFGHTEMGRDLLAQDYLLKQITASLIYPEDEFGKKFWKRIYEEAVKRFGTTNIPVNTFNKVWIVPEHAKVYEHGNTAFVVKARLKVMLEEDYLTFVKKQGQRNDVNALGSQIIREIVIPALETEVNEGKNFAPLRQVYNSLVLAVWFKKRMKDSILGRKYMDQNKAEGIHYERSVILSAAKDLNVQNDTQAIYQRYLQAFKKGVYNYIKEESDPLTQQAIPRKYFSGGAQMGDATKTTEISDTMMESELSEDRGNFETVFVNLASHQGSQSLGKIDQQMDAEISNGDGENTVFIKRYIRGGESKPSDKEEVLKSLEEKGLDRPTAEIVLGTYQTAMIDLVKKKIQDKPLKLMRVGEEKIGARGMTMLAYQIDDPQLGNNIIVKFPRPGQKIKDGRNHYDQVFGFLALKMLNALIQSGMTQEQAREELTQRAHKGIINAYKMASNKLGKLFTPIIIEDLTLDVENEKGEFEIVHVPYVIIQEKVDVVSRQWDPLDQEEKEIAQAIQQLGTRPLYGLKRQEHEDRLGVLTKDKEDINRKKDKLREQFNHLHNELKRAGIEDKDAFNWTKNYGFTHDDKLTVFDADSFALYGSPLKLSMMDEKQLDQFNQTYPDQWSPLPFIFNVLIDSQWRKVLLFLKSWDKKENISGKIHSIVAEDLAMGSKNSDQAMITFNEYESFLRPILRQYDHEQGLNWSDIVRQLSGENVDQIKGLKFQRSRHIISDAELTQEEKNIREAKEKFIEGDVDGAKQYLDSVIKGDDVLARRAKDIKDRMEGVMDPGLTAMGRQILILEPTASDVLRAIKTLALKEGSYGQEEIKLQIAIGEIWSMLNIPNSRKIEEFKILANILMSAVATYPDINDLTILIENLFLRLADPLDPFKNTIPQEIQDMASRMDGLIVDIQGYDQPRSGDDDLLAEKLSMRLLLIDENEIIDPLMTILRKMDQVSPEDSSRQFNKILVSHHEDPKLVRAIRGLLVILERSSDIKGSSNNSKVRDCVALLLASLGENLKEDDPILNSIAGYIGEWQESSGVARTQWVESMERYGVSYLKLSISQQAKLLKSILEKKDLAQLADTDQSMDAKLNSSAKVLKSAPGGIDLTADRMKVDVESDKASMIQPLDLKALEGIEINGLYIKSIEFKPLNDLPQLLGVSN